MKDGTELPKSLRRDSEFVGQSNDYGVTQDFQDFLAKQLAESLDKYVEEIDDDENVSESSKEKKKKRKKSKKMENTSAGIKLMSDSKVDLNHTENDNREQNIEHNKRRRKELGKGDNSTGSISKCREVAVNPDWILSKASTASWANKQKGTVYRYKKSKDGSLTEINEVEN